MPPKLPRPLRQQLLHAAQTAPAMPWDLIVTLSTMDACEALERRGFKIALRLDEVMAVSGSATPAVALALARLRQVRRIESDAGMEALGEG